MIRGSEVEWKRGHEKKMKGDGREGGGQEGRLLDWARNKSKTKKAQEAHDP